jgi:DNA recombination-dependent growth factor C
MGILSGALTARRYRVVGEVPADFRERFAEALRAHAFRASSDPTRTEESVGWCEIHNLLDLEFADLNRWLCDRYAIFALRVDKRTVPAKLFAAHLAKRMEAWCQEHRRERCPANVRGELKEQLLFEMLARTLPRVQVFELCWNVVDGWLVFHSLSERACERFTKLFFETFGLRALPAAPLDLLSAADAPLADLLLATAGLDYRPEVPR